MPTSFIKLSRIYWENFIFDQFPFCCSCLELLSLAGMNSWGDFHCGVTLLKKGMRTYKYVLSQYKPVWDSGILYQLNKARAVTAFPVSFTCFMKASFRAFPPKLQTPKLPREQTLHPGRSRGKQITCRRKLLELLAMMFIPFCVFSSCVLAKEH